MCCLLLVPFVVRSRCCLLVLFDLLFLFGVVARGVVCCLLCVVVAWCLLPLLK